MKSILILISIGCVLVCLVKTEPVVKAPTYSLNNLNLHFENFKLQYGKTYQNKTHHDKRKEIFASHLQKINDHNEKYNNGQSTYTLGTTVFADWHPDEFAAYVKKGLKAKPNLTNANVVSLLGATAPASIDYRNYNGKNYVQAIKHQGVCGSCWSFAAVSAVESYAALANGGNVPNLSEQNLVDCVYKYDSCNTGGNDDEAWNYLINSQAGGIATAANYPYVSGNTNTWNGKCKYVSSMNPGVKVTGYNTLPAMNEAALVQTLGTIGPITAYIYASSFSFSLYTSGIYTDYTCYGSACPASLTDHAIMLEGYGTDSTGKAYYILRNSWGTGWGMNGYMNLARGNNMIGVATTNFYPIVSVSGSTATAPVTTTAKPVTTTAKPVTTTAKPVTTTLSPVITTITSAKPVIKACPNGSGYYVVPNSGCQKYYYCDDFYLYTYSTAFICGSRYILNQDTQSCVSSTSTCVTSSGICTNGSGYYNYPGCGSVYYCSRYVNQYTVPSGTLFNPETNSFVSSSSTSFKCPF